MGCEWCVQHVCGVSGVCGVCMHVCDTCSTGNWLQDILGWQVPSATISRWFHQWSRFVVRSNLRWKEDHSSADSQPLAGEVHAFVWCGVLACVSTCICTHLHDTVCCVLDIDYSIACIWMVCIFLRHLSLCLCMWQDYLLYWSILHCYFILCAGTVSCGGSLLCFHDNPGTVV